MFIIILMQGRKIGELEHRLGEVYYILGYYRVRFGDVSKEDVENLVGIDRSKVEKFEVKIDKQ
jgi:hypothetical protein